MLIDFSVRGEGDALVLVHGLFGSRENLGAIAKHLSEFYTVYSVDLPNHGRSKHVDDFDLSSMAEALKSWMDETNLSCAHYFGHSLGGKAAMELALSSPQYVDKLVVADIAPVKYGHRHEGVFGGLLDINLGELDSRVTADKVLAKKVPEKPVRSFLLKNLQRSSEGEFSWRMNLGAIHKHYAELIRANHLGLFDRPVLFLKAEDSDYIKAEHKAEIMSRFPAAELKVVSNTGHWLHAEKPELISRLVKRFLDD